MEEGHPELKEATEEQRDRFRAGMKRVGAAHPPASLEDYVDHVDHAVQTSGVGHVGFGSDFDGGGDLLPDAAAYSTLSQGLVNRGYAPEDIVGIMGGNLLRLLEETIG